MRASKYHIVKYFTNRVMLMVAVLAVLTITLLVLIDGSPWLVLARQHDFLP